MVSQAPAHPRIRYEHGRAELLPLEDRSADLITVSLAFHWLDRAHFLPEALRVLRPGGTLIIYWNDFHGEMVENPEFEKWTFGQYLVRYPKPPRHGEPLTEEDARTHGFRFAGREEYTNQCVFSPEELVECLLTHTNIIAAVEQGNESLPAALAWLLESVKPYFLGPTGTFIFGGEILYLRAAMGYLDA